MAKSPKGRAGTGRMQLDAPQDKLRAMGRGEALKGRTSLPGAKPVQATGPKPVQLTAEQSSKKG